MRLGWYLEMPIRNRTELCTHAFFKRHRWHIAGCIVLQPTAPQAFKETSSASSTRWCPAQSNPPCMFSVTCRTNESTYASRDWYYIMYGRKHLRTAAVRASPFVLHYGLQLPGIAESVLNHHSTTAHDILLRRQHLLFLLREVYPTILGCPSTRLCELNDCAF